MKGPREIGPGVFVVAGPELTDDRDALAYLVSDGDELALVDCGAGPSYGRIVENIRLAGGDPGRLRLLIATHAHIDHIGALAAFQRDFGTDVAAHEADRDPIERADPERTAANWYGLDLEPARVDVCLKGPEQRLFLGQTELVCLHTPGHTPGSIVVWFDRDGRRYLFGQDIHGPFSPAFGSDKEAWRESMLRLIDLGADVLGEGHYGVFEGKSSVTAFIRRFLD